MSGSPASPNFGFLAQYDPLLAKYGGQAERYLFTDPNTALMKLRQFVEVLVGLAVAQHGLYSSEQDSLNDRIRLLRDRNIIDYRISDLLHRIKNTGNRAAHHHEDNRREALFLIRMAREVGIWFHRAYKDPGFKPGPFIPPPDPRAAEAALREELERLREQQAKQQAELRQTRLSADEARAEAERLEEEARRAWLEAETALELAQETEELLAREHEEHQRQLGALQARASTATAHEAATAQQLALQAANALELDEKDTRRLIDAQLQAAGWEADSEELRFSKGTRPIKGRNLAIAEWPTGSGPADYALFVGLTAVGVVEAKKMAKDVASDIKQAERYAKGIVLHGEAELPAGAPWQTEYRVPFVFSTNGRPFLEQLRTKSGIWFRDLRRAANASRPLLAWRSPQGLLDELEQNVDAAHEALHQESIDHLPMRDYQREAIDSVEKAIESGQERILIAMATGTGKTRVAIGLCYRLLKANRFRRILFLVDRKTLGRQAFESFDSLQIEHHHRFTDVFNVKKLGEIEPDKETKLHFATVQGMVKRILYADDPSDAPRVDDYDCIIVDETHRGYNLDAQMSEAEMNFRDQAEYVSRYRRVLDYFDAVRIGLTATPAAHTVEIFGPAVFKYSYTRAVVEGFLVPFDPPYRIPTRLAKDGIHFVAGQTVQGWEPTTQGVSTHTMPDDVDIDVTGFNRMVITKPFNEAVCTRLVENIDPDSPGKTLIFAVDNQHADMVVDILREKYRDQDPEFDEKYVVKITGSVDKPEDQIRRFRNEPDPNIVVTVDLLTTGVDVPSICTIVFLRRVGSRILYEQMIGRATRLCKNLYSPGQHKEAFRIFDAVDLWAQMEKFTEMKPVVVKPSFTYAQLAEELSKVEEPEARRQILDQFITKLQRKAQRMSEAGMEAFTAVAGEGVQAALAKLRKYTPGEAALWLGERPGLPGLLDELKPPPPWVPISTEEDEPGEIELAFPKGRAPGDYLEEFGAYIREHINELPALVAVTQKPRELTRKQLMELRLALARDGYGERLLRAAFAQQSNKDIAASIMGFIRGQALGEPLVPYEQRVDAAMARILASKRWTRQQQGWLERIGKAMKKDYVVDRDALDSGRFRQKGGFRRLDALFGGELESVLGELQEALWEEAG